MAGFSDKKARILSLIDKSIIKFKTRFIEIVKQIKDDLDMKEIERLLSTGQVGQVLDMLQIEIHRLGRPWGDAFVVAGDSTASFIGNALHIVVDFNPINERALRIIKENQIRMVGTFIQDQVAATRRALVSGVERGINPLDMAREFRGSIGLTERQVEHVGNYRRNLENLERRALTRELRDKRFNSTVDRAIRNKQPLTTKQIDKMVDRYRQNYIKYRSEVIARTEALRATHMGADEMYNQAIDNGTLDAAKLTQHWSTTQLPNVRDPAHTRMHGKIQPIGQPFVSGKNNLLRFPGDPNAPPEETIQCACVKTTRYKA